MTENQTRSENQQQPATDYPDYDNWYADADAEGHHWRLQNKIAGLGVVVSGLTLVAAVAAAIIAYCAFTATTKAAGEAKREADEAHRQADAAELQVAVAKDTEQRQLRAYVLIGDFGVFCQDCGDTALTPNALPQIKKLN